MKFMSSFLSSCNTWYIAFNNPDTSTLGMEYPSSIFLERDFNQNTH